MFLNLNAKKFWNCRCYYRVTNCPSHTTRFSKFEVLLKSNKEFASSQNLYRNQKQPSCEHQFKAFKQTNTQASMSNIKYQVSIQSCMNMQRGMNIWMKRCKHKIIKTIATKLGKKWPRPNANEQSLPTKFHANTT